MRGRSFLDTNVLVYAVDRADAVKHERAVDILAAAADAVISAQVLNEFYVVVTRKLAIPLSPDVAAEMVTRLARLTCVPVDADLVRDGIVVGQRWQLPHWDALLVAAARQAGCQTILTEDLSTGAEYEGVRIVNPFVEQG